MAKETLTSKEKKAQNNFLAGLKIRRKKTRKPVIVAIVGLTGSGKSSVAREIARLIGATVIEGNEIRIHLRRQKERFEGARKIAWNITEKVIKGDGNVVLDSDYIDAKKRASLKEKARRIGAQLIFIRTHTDRDVMIERIISAKYPANGFFENAIVKIREMWRRTPNHYHWDPKGGGNWVLKKLPFPVFASINTTYPGKWPVEVKKVTQKLLKF